MNQLLQYLIDTKSLEIKDHPPFFKWSSGIESPIYNDNRRLLSHPHIRKEIVNAFVEKLMDIKTDAICGVATAGISWGALIAHELNLPFIYVRTSAKAHGKQNVIEGDLKGIKNCVVIEDLISTGKSSLKACEQLKEHSINPILVMSLFQYNLTEAEINFKRNKIPFYSLTSMNELLATTLLNNEQVSNIQDFYAH